MGVRVRVRVRGRVRVRVRARVRDRVRVRVRVRVSGQWEGWVAVLLWEDAARPACREGARTLGLGLRLG